MVRLPGRSGGYLGMTPPMVCYADLLADGARKHALSIHESPAVTPQLLEGGDRGVGDVYVRGLSEVRVTSLRDVLRLLHSGARNRSTRETDVNEQSSRSHAILQLSVRSTTASADGATLSRRAKFNMVDLAGSERWQPRTAMTSAHTRELRAINSSLSALGNVIAALTDASRKHVPYRDSKLTRLLQVRPSRRKGRVALTPTRTLTHTHAHRIGLAWRQHAHSAGRHRLPLCGGGGGDAEHDGIRRQSQARDDAGSGQRDR